MIKTGVNMRDLAAELERKLAAPEVHHDELDVLSHIDGPEEEYEGRSGYQAVKKLLREAIFKPNALEIQNQMKEILGEAA